MIERSLDRLTNRRLNPVSSHEAEGCT